MTNKVMNERWVVSVEAVPGSGEVSYVKSLNGNRGGRTFDPMLADHWPTREEALDEAIMIRRETRGSCLASAARVFLEVEIIDPEEHLRRWAETGGGLDRRCP